MNIKEHFFKENGYNTVLGSPINYEELVVYIWINGEEVALVQKEEGPDKIVVEFFGEPIKTKIYYDVFLEALQAAKEELLR